MELSKINKVYFIGIGGIGMSAIARFFHRLGKKVAGYDKTSTYLTTELESEGIKIHFEDNVDNIEKKFLEKEDTLVVITPAIPREHREWEYFRENDFVIKKRAEVLGIITKNSFCLAVSGTHGKTTTSSMLAHIMYQAKTEVTSFLGGILENYQTNLVGDGTEITVVEADEFDRSFLHLYPDITCVISNDADHLDIYGDVDTIQQSFREFAERTKDKTKLFVAENVPIDGVKVGFGDKAEIRATNLEIRNGKRYFDLVFPDERVEQIEIVMPGNHNVLNASLAFAMAKSYGISSVVIKEALAGFKGVRRRFSVRLNTKDKVLVDDYAHHPTEINAVYQGVREMFPNRKITAVFQPHLYSRTRDFMNEFAQSLSKFDEVILLDIYPARELPIDGVTSEKILEKITNPVKYLVEKSQLLQFLKNNDTDVLVTIGAGDIGEMIDDIQKLIEQK